MKISNLLTTLLLSIFVISCGKDKDPENNPNESNRLKTLEFIYSDFNELYEYSYDESNIVKQIRHSGKIGTKGFNEIYNVTKSGNTISHKYVYPSSEYDGYYSIRKYIVNNNRLIESIDEEYDDEDKLSYLNTETYTYNSSNQLTKVVIFTKFIEMGNESEDVYELTYNANGKLAKITTKYDKITSIIEEFFYSGNTLTHSVSEYIQSGKTETTRFEFNNDGLIKITEYDEENEIDDFTEIKYLSKGLIKSITYSDTDGEYLTTNRTYEQGTSNSKYIYYDIITDAIQQDLSAFRTSTTKGKKITFKDLYLKGRL